MAADGRGWPLMASDGTPHLVSYASVLMTADDRGWPLMTTDCTLIR